MILSFSKDSLLRQSCFVLGETFWGYLNLCRVSMLKTFSASDLKRSSFFSGRVVFVKRAVHRQHEGVLRVFYQRPSEQAG